MKSDIEREARVCECSCRKRKPKRKATCRRLEAAFVFLRLLTSKRPMKSDMKRRRRGFASVAAAKENQSAKRGFASATAAKVKQTIDHSMQKNTGKSRIGYAFTRGLSGQFIKGSVRGG